MSRLLIVFYVCGGWSLILILCGLIRRARLPGDVVASSSRLLAIVPAHNEEAVVADTVWRLRHAGCTVVVVADRCTDLTVQICKLEGFLVYEVDEGNKGRAIDRFLDESVLSQAFEGVCVVDCGTIVSVGFGGRTLYALQEYRYVQSWLRSMSQNTWIGAWYCWNFALYHLVALGRDLLGFPALIGGSGFAWRGSEYVRFDDRCLVEDLELSLRLHSAGIQIGYLDLGVYDEKPATLKVSILQRLRWERGGWWLVFHGRFLTWRLDDFCAVWGSVASLFWGFGLGYIAITAPLQFGICVGFYMVIGCAGLVKLEQLHKWRWTLLFSIPLMSMLEGFISLWALVTFTRKSWVRTPHSAGSVLP